MKRKEKGREVHLAIISRNRHTGRDDRATTENVMDPRTRFILYQMLNRGQLKEINGCISTGKEVLFLKKMFTNRPMYIMRLVQMEKSWQ